MSMAEFRSNVRQMIAQAIAGTGQLKIGLVTDYDPDRPAVKVNLQPENIETGWMQMTSLLSGPSFGVFVGPVAGLEALVVFQEGDLQVGVCIGFLGNDEDVPPSVPAGQMLLVDSSGSQIAFTNDGNIHSTGTWLHTGAFTATGEGTFNGGHTVSQHTHTQPADAHGDIEQPTNKPTG